MMIFFVVAVVIVVTIVAIVILMKATGIGVSEKDRRAYIKWLDSKRKS